MRTLEICVFYFMGGLLSKGTSQDLRARFQMHSQTGWGRFPLTCTLVVKQLQENAHCPTAEVACICLSLCISSGRPIGTPGHLSSSSSRPASWPRPSSFCAWLLFPAPIPHFSLFYSIPQSELPLPVGLHPPLQANWFPPCATPLGWECPDAAYSLTKSQPSCGAMAFPRRAPVSRHHCWSVLTVALLSAIHLTEQNLLYSIFLLFKCLSTH